MLLRVRCPILPDEGEIAIEDLISNDGMIVTLSNRGYIKRTAASGVPSAGPWRKRSEGVW